MRNLFDQYSQPENRLTHALMSSLQSDRKLLERFVLRFTGQRIDGKAVEVMEQSLPGEPIEYSEEEASRRGLPDGCISNPDGRALLIESKFAAAINPDQLRRHRRTAARRGLDVEGILLLTVERPSQRLPKGTVPILWSDLYQWLQSEQKHSSWARSCAEYLEAAESKAVYEEYLLRGGLTVFSGIPFSVDEPYTYLQAKRLLRLLMQEMRAHKRLKRTLPIRPSHPGRGAITGKQSDAVWDFIALGAPRKAYVFTQHPHLTADIHTVRLSAYLTVPNGVRSYMRRQMLGKDYDEFEHRILTVANSIRRASANRRGIEPFVALVQRHYPSQRSLPTVDALIKYNPFTSEATGRRSGSVKHQPQWLRATYESLRHRKSNLQFQIGAEMGYRDCSIVKSSKVVDAIADVWIATKPLIDVMFQNH